jgi:hypothetical protein
MWEALLLFVTQLRSARVVKAHGDQELSAWKSAPGRTRQLDHVTSASAFHRVTELSTPAGHKISAICTTGGAMALFISV